MFSNLTEIVRQDPVNSAVVYPHFVQVDDPDYQGLALLHYIEASRYGTAQTFSSRGLYFDAAGPVGDAFSLSWANGAEQRFKFVDAKGQATLGWMGDCRHHLANRSAAGGRG